MTTLLDTEAFDKIQYPPPFFYLKKDSVRQEQMEYFSTSNIFENPTANIFNGERPNAFPLQSETNKQKRKMYTLATSL